MDYLTPRDPDQGAADDRRETLAKRTTAASDREVPPIAVELIHRLGLEDDQEVWALVTVALKNVFALGVNRGIVDAVLQAREQGDGGWLADPETAGQVDI